MGSCLLVIGDDTQFWRHVRSTFTPLGYQLVETRGTKDATSHLLNDRPSLALVRERLTGKAPSREIAALLREQCTDLRILFHNQDEEPSVRALGVSVSDSAQGRPREPAPSAIPRAPQGSSGDTPRAAADDTAGSLIGESPQIRRLRSYVQKVALADCTVLVMGETGTGKELVATLIHELGHRRTHPFVAMNCAAFPEGLLESELFGYERGAFTGAYTSREGKFRQGQGGTVFLDEIGDLSLAAQAKLLRVIENREVQALGGRTTTGLDIRVVAATNQNLETLVQRRLFRPDLYYRLSVACISIPPLRERKEDIAPLVAHFIAELNRKRLSHVTTVGAACLDALLAYDWPGNVRELRNVLEAVFVEVPSGRIEIEHLPETFHRRLEAASSGETPERDRILGALFASNWNKSRAAKRLQLSRMTLYRKMRGYQITPSPAVGIPPFDRGAGRRPLSR